MTKSTLTFDFTATGNIIDLLKGYSTPKLKLCHFSLTPCRSKPIKVLFVFGIHFKICWIKLQNAYTLLYQPGHKGALFVFKSERKTMHKTHPCVAADTEACTHFASKIALH